MDDPMNHPDQCAGGITRRRNLTERQARVGIVANKTEVGLPMHSPREVWVRWPKLRSARRLEEQRSAAQPETVAKTPADPILSGLRLNEFRDALRSSQAGPAVAADHRSVARGSGRTLALSMAWPGSPQTRLRILVLGASGAIAIAAFFLIL